MSNILSQTLDDINGMRRRFDVLRVSIKVLNSILIATTVLCLWIFLKPDADMESIGLSIVVFLLLLLIPESKTSPRLEKQEFLVALDMSNPDTRIPPYELNQEYPTLNCIDEWQPRLNQAIKNARSTELGRLRAALSSMLMPLLMLLLASFIEPRALVQAITKVSHAVARLSDGATLKVVSGLPGDQSNDLYELTTKSTPQIELLTQNMIEVKVIGEPGIRPQVDLRRIVPGGNSEDQQAGQEVFQSFGLVAQPNANHPSHSVYSISFAIKDDVNVFLSTVSSTTPVASIKVRQLPIPKVDLALGVKLIKPWPDDRPLPLKIGVSSENPLHQIRLQIRAEGRIATEVVSNILATDKKSVRTDYDLILETYVQSDISQVEIIAEAVDRAIPIPLVGRSEPIVIETASAYGRYQQTLNTLKELKGLVDDGVQKQDPSLPKEAQELVETALNQSQNSPFFDGVDRVQMNQFKSNVNELMQSPQMMTALDLQENLNDFLFEHETMDDKERDRDFFVAARSLSRLIEESPQKRAITPDAVTQRIKSYLEERHKRWERRVKHLESKPKSWDSIQAQPFAKSMDNIENFDGKNTSDGQKQALGELSQTVSKYRSWLDELESHEEQARKKQEEKRQEGLTSARNQLKELQKLQGDISKRLDKSASRNQEEISENWPTTRLMQNDNIKGSSSLEAQLRSLSPQAGERIKAATEAMKSTVSSGGQKSFAQAESNADLAGRLLRQAQSDAQKSQKEQQKRERRRRISGDNYYGKRIIGGDVEIKREYSVDRRYREEVLNDVSQSKLGNGDEDDARVLEDYLRKIVR